jgi:hypothetical protein
VSSDVTTERRGRVVDTATSGGLGSNLGPMTSFPQPFQVNARTAALNYATTASFQILSNSSFTCHPLIKRYTVLVIKKSLLNYK